MSMFEFDPIKYTVINNCEHKNACRSKATPSLDDIYGSAMYIACKDCGTLSRSNDGGRHYEVIRDYDVRAYEEYR